MKRLFSMILAVLMIVGTLAITAFAADDVYSDVKEGKWFYDAVMEAYEKELMFGSDGKFRPNDTMNRAEMVTLISRLAGVDLDGYKVSKKFKDVGMTSWYTPVVCWASDEGLVGGYSDGTFKPTAPIKRQELAKLIVGLVDYLDAFVPDAEDAAEPFKDFSKIQSWAKDYVEALRKTGLVKGDNMGNFNPLKTATRAEVATIAVRLYPYLNGELTVQQIIDHYADTVCAAHSHFHVTMGKGADFTVENFETSILNWMGLDPAKYEVEVDPEGVEDAKDGYASQGFGCAEKAILEVTLKDLTTGETSEPKEIEYYCTKYPGVVGGTIQCPDDHVPDQILENLDSYFELDDGGRIKIPLGGGATFTRDNISDKVMEKVGLDPRLYKLVITDNGDDTFEDARECHSGINHGQTHAREFTVAIKNLPDYEFYGGEAEDPTSSEKATTKEYTWSFWFSKDVTAVYENSMPESGSTIVFTGSELTKEALDEAISNFIIEADSLNQDFKHFEYDFDAVKAAFDGGAASVSVDMRIVQPTTDFPFGNMAGLPDTVLERTYTIAVPAGVNDYGEGAQTKVDLKKVDSSIVKKDGVISTGEYYQIITDKTMVVEKPGSANYKTDVKFYVSWDEVNGVNFAAEMSAANFAQNVNFHGRNIGDDCIIGGTSFVFNSMFNDADHKTGVYYAVTKDLSTGEYSEGGYNGQLGSTFCDLLDFDPAEGTDYVINYADGKAIIEWSVPFEFMAPASVTLEDGAEMAFTFAALNGEGNGWDSANTVYAQGIGQMVPFADGKDQVYPAILVLQGYGSAPEYAKVSDYNDGNNVKIDLKKATGDVVKDGKISAGEYFMIDTDKTFVVDKGNASYKTDAKFYTSWNENGINFAATIKADKLGQTIEFEGGRMVGDDCIIGGTSFVLNTLVPKEGADFSKKDAYSTGVYYAVSKSLDDSTYNEGTYSGQIGEPFGAEPLNPAAGTDYVISYTADGYAVCEWTVPFSYALPAGSVLADGTEMYLTFAAMNGEGKGWDSAGTVYGQGIGQMVPFADSKDQIYPAIFVLQDFGAGIDTVDDYNDGVSLKIDLKKADSSKVVKDGMISSGEYFKVNSDKITAMNKAGEAYTFTADFYVSWDEVHGINFATIIKSDNFEQHVSYEGGRAIGDDWVISGTSFGIMSHIPGKTASTGLYYVVSKLLDGSGKYNEGCYADQLGTRFGRDTTVAYDPEAGEDYIISYGDGLAVCEWSIPFEYFVPGMDDAVFGNGYEIWATFYALNGEGLGQADNYHVYGLGLGQFIPFAPAKERVNDAIFVLRDYDVDSKSFEAVKDYNDCDNIKVDLKKVNAANVVKDGVISPDEYYLIDTADKFTIVNKSGKAGYKTTVQFYASWDEVHGLNLAAVMNADKGVGQNVKFDEGRKIGDDAIIAGTSFVLNTMDSGVNNNNSVKTNVYYAIAKNFDGTGYSEGGYNNQLGTLFGGADDFDPAEGTDYVINYYCEKSLVTVIEWSVPMKYCVPSTTPVAQGSEIYITFAAMNGIGNGYDGNYKIYGTGLGQMVPFANAADQKFPAIFVINE